MKKTKQFLAFTLVAFVIAIGCNKDDDTVVPKEPQQKEDSKKPKVPVPQGQFNMVDVQVNLPADSNLDLSNTTIFTLASPSEVDANGSSELPLTPEQGNWLF